jgi:hypothetical protein
VPGYNHGMRRLSLPLAAVGILALAPAALGADPTGSSVADTDLASEPLLPYVVGLLVAAVTLAIVGVVVTVLRGRRPAGRTRRDRAAWWTCPACQAANAPGGPACYACHAPRPTPRAPGPTPSDEVPDMPTSGPAVTPRAGDPPPQP